MTTLSLDGVAIPSAPLSGRHECTFGRSDDGLIFTKRAADAHRRPALAREAAIYRLLDGIDSLTTRLVPRLVGFDGTSLSVTGYVANDLAECVRIDGRVDPAVAAAVGRALAVLHANGPRCAALPAATAVTVGQVHRPDPAFLWGLSIAGIELVRLIQRSVELCEHLSVGKATQMDAFVHADVRFENILIASSGQGTPRVLFVDFENAGHGDARVDVGGFVAACLAFWLDSFPAIPGCDLATLVASASWPEARLRVALASFLDAYVDQRGSDLACARTFCEGAFAAAATRLVYATLESTTGTEVLSLHAAAKLQLAVNIFREPRGALGSFTNVGGAHAPGEGG